MRKAVATALILFGTLPACAPRVPKGMDASRARLAELSATDAYDLLPEEYRSFRALLSEAEEHLKKREMADAEAKFVAAEMKAELLRRHLDEEKARRAEQARVRAEEEARRERERLAAEAEKKRVAEEEARKKREKEEEEVRLQAEKARKERALATTHQVKKGETLPGIAAYPEIYNDASLWPLLYRANRDQIRDPRMISAGQVLMVPRNVSREDISEARRFAQEKPFFQ